MAEGTSPLILAIDAGHRPTFDLILEARADANAVCSTGESPLMLSAFFADVEMVLKLINAGAHVNFADDRRRTPLTNAIPFRDERLEFGEEHLTDVFATVAALTAAGAQLDAQTTDGVTASQMAEEAYPEAYCEDNYGRQSRAIRRSLLRLLVPLGHKFSPTSPKYSPTSPTPSTHQPH